MDENGEGFTMRKFIVSSLYVVRVTKSRSLRWAGHVATTGECSSAFYILTGKPTGKCPLGRRRNKWEKCIKMVLKKREKIS